MDSYLQLMFGAYVCRARKYVPLVDLANTSLPQEMANALCALLTGSDRLTNWFSLADNNI